VSEQPLPGDPSGARTDWFGRLPPHVPLQSCHWPDITRVDGPMSVMTRGRQTRTAAIGHPISRARPG